MWRAGTAGSAAVRVPAQGWLRVWGGHGGGSVVVRAPQPRTCGVVVVVVAMMDSMRRTVTSPRCAADTRIPRVCHRAAVPGPRAARVRGAGRSTERRRPRRRPRHDARISRLGRDPGGGPAVDAWPMEVAAARPSSRGRDVRHDAGRGRAIPVCVRRPPAGGPGQQRVLMHAVEGSHGREDPVRDRRHGGGGGCGGARTFRDITACVLTWGKRNPDVSDVLPKALSGTRPTSGVAAV